MSRPETAPPPPAPYASLRRRCAAGLIDLVPTAVLVVLGTWLFAGWGFVLGMVLAIVYFTLFEAHGGQTPGKRLAGIRVLHLDGQPCTWLGSVLRNGFRIVDAFPGIYLIGITSIGGSRRKQRLGDQAGGTSVYLASGDAEVQDPGYHGSFVDSRGGVSDVATRDFALPKAASVRENPSAQELQELAAAMTNARRTDYGAVNVQTAVLARSTSSTFIVSDEPDGQNRTISRAEYARVSALQDAYIAEQDMVLVQGYIGSNPETRTAAQLYVEAANANIAGMQQQLYFPPSDGHEAELTVIYTPNLRIEGYENERLIAVDVDAGVTRVFNSDYFGESKKGGLRMWNQRVYERGGLPLHAGCKVIPTGDGEKVALIVGLSGTGKTTTTFTRQNGSLPVQDDFVAWNADGTIDATEAGCFAKTFALSPEDEPTIHGAVTRSEAYLENVSMDDAGKVDFFDTSYTKNGRATFSFSVIEAADARNIERAHFLLVLNKNENIIPAVAHLEGPQSAAYFMLGETQGTSAGGAAEAGKFLRVPGTNPFFPLPHGLQGNRFLELAQRNPLDVYLMNTGRVGGADGVEGSRKVRIPHSSAIVKGIAEGTIEWETDPDFGYQVAARVPGIPDEDIELLQPRRLYERLGRADEYAALVARFKAERAEYLERYPELGAAIVDAVS